MLTDNLTSLYVNIEWIKHCLDQFSAHSWRAEHEDSDSRTTLVATFTDVDNFIRNYPELLI